MSGPHMPVQFQMGDFGPHMDIRVGRLMEGLKVSRREAHQQLGAIALVLYHFRVLDAQRTGTKEKTVHLFSLRICMSTPSCFRNQLRM